MALVVVMFDSERKGMTCAEQRHGFRGV
jgi:hypothetical protein